MRQSSSLDTERGRAEAGRELGAGSRALGGEGWTAGTSGVRKPVFSRCHISAPHAQSFPESTPLTCTLAS